MNSLDGSRVLHVEWIICFSEYLDSESINYLVNKYKRISSVTIHSSPVDENLQVGNSANILYVKQGMESFKWCGIVHHSFFTINISHFTESQHHNTCLNRKIAIDVEGNIKNCPSMSQSFGNIRDTTLQEALDHPDFKKYWNVTKDQISVCKDCEFRHICTDCRAYLENPEDRYSKPLKCGYNPYTCEWEEWSTNPLKQQAIDHYGMREVLPEFKT